MTLVSDRKEITVLCAACDGQGWTPSYNTQPEWTCEECGGDGVYVLKVTSMSFAIDKSGEWASIEAVCEGPPNAYLSLHNLGGVNIASEPERPVRAIESPYTDWELGDEGCDEFPF